LLAALGSGRARCSRRCFLRFNVHPPTRLGVCSSPIFKPTACLILLLILLIDWGHFVFTLSSSHSLHALFSLSSRSLHTLFSLSSRSLLTLFHHQVRKRCQRVYQRRDSKSNDRRKAQGPHRSHRGHRVGPTCVSRQLGCPVCRRQWQVRWRHRTLAVTLSRRLHCCCHNAVVAVRMHAHARVRTRPCVCCLLSSCAWATLAKRCVTIVYCVKMFLAPQIFLLVPAARDTS
jgi:hypothetical protein